MKNLLIVPALLIGMLASAQKKGLLIYGSAAYQSTTEMDYKTKQTTINPGIGYGITPSWTIGAVLGYVHTRLQGGFSNDQEYSVYTAGPFVRYSKPLTELFHLYGQLEGGATWGKQETNQFMAQKIKGSYVSLVPALFVNVKNYFGLNFNIGGATYITTKPEGATSSTKQFTFNIGRTVEIGISKIF